MTSDQKSRAERKRDARKHALVAAARKVLTRAGIGELTIEAVAEEADVSKPSVHYYFPTKEALAAAIVVEVALEEIRTYEEATHDAATFAEACDRAIAAFVARYQDDLASFRAHYVWSQVFRVRDPSLEALPTAAGKLISRLAALAERDQRAGRLSRKHSPRALVNVVAAIGAGILVRAALLEANAGRSLVSIDEVAREARLLMALALSPPKSR